MKTLDEESLTYRDAGVDIDRANRLVERIKSIAGRTSRPGVVGGIGGFGALFEIPPGRYHEPVLVSSTDGVGTKLRLAIDSGIHHTIGIDLVAMCVNDILAQGAEPLFFLDYLATGRLDSEVAESIIEGIAHGCELAGTALIGGETAEMPGMYADGDYDLAGFSVGVVEKSRILDGTRAAAGDAIVGIAASGPHSNGFSLIRRILHTTRTGLDARFGEQTLGEALLAPTRIYVRPLLELLSRVEVHAVAHITGGGLLENIPRVLPAGLGAHLDARAWTRPAVFDWIQKGGRIADKEMLRTFNCGLGMVLCLPGALAPQALAVLAENGETAWRVGTVTAGAEIAGKVLVT